MNNDFLIIPTIDFQYYWINGNNGKVWKREKLPQTPLGNYIHTAKNLDLQGATLSCQLLNEKGEWIHNHIIFNLEHFYSNHNGKFIATPFVDSLCLPRGNWIVGASNIKIKKVSDKTGHLRCLLQSTHSFQDYQEIIYNYNDVYENFKGAFFVKEKRLLDPLLEIPPIPKNIFQTHRSQAFVDSKKELQSCQETWLQWKDFSYYFHNDSTSREFIRVHFDAKVLEAYDRCPLHVMKADLWRYCVIYIHGGIYADMDALLVQNPEIFLQSRSWLVLAPEIDDIHMCQWTFAAPPHSPILGTIIDLAVERILATKHIKGFNIIHYLTGPGVFTDGIDRYMESLGISPPDKKRDYEAFQNYVVHVFDFTHFHNKIIHHLFAGDDAVDGWKPQRDRVLV